MAFPRPPGSVLKLLQQLEILRRGDEAEMADAGDLVDLPRPWDPDTCPRGLAEDLWAWYGEFAAWVNHEYAWRPQQMIPSCWLAHRHILRELPVLALLRWSAEEALSAHLLEEWHRNTLPGFLDRMARRLGESACRDGRHIEWPGQARYASFLHGNPI